MAVIGFITVILAIIFLQRVTLIGDNLLRRKIDRIVPDLSELIADPIKALSSPYRIGPRKRYFTGVMTGLVVAIYSGFLTGDVILDNRPGRTFQEGDWDMIALAVFASFVPVAIAISIWLRGSEVLVRAEGPLFMYRRQTVSCPWSLFRNDAEPVWLGSFTLVVPINEESVDQVAQTNPDGTSLSGWKVRSRPCKPWSYDGAPMTSAKSRHSEFLMEDLYECELPEILSLFRNIAMKTSL